jgi:two-component system, LytTR family, response regulator
MKFSTLIVDDEELARDGLKLLLQEFEEFEVVGEAENGFDAIKMINKLKPDIVFLDIQMPKLDGFDVVSLLSDDPPMVVFVTAYDEYAIKAFEVHAVDYLMKPVKPSRLKGTLDKILKESGHNTKGAKLSALIKEHENQIAPLNRVVVRDGTRVYIVNIEDIAFIRAEDDYVSITVKEGKSYLKHDTLSRMEKLLITSDFCRIHRSYILNINYLSKIEPYSKDSKVAVLKDGTQLSISRSGYSRLMNILTLS